MPFKHKKRGCVATLLTAMRTQRSALLMVGYNPIQNGPRPKSLISRLVTVMHHDKSRDIFDYSDWMHLNLELEKEKK